MDMQSRFPIGTQIAINRFPHDCKSPTHRVVGYRDDNYLRIRPLNIADDVKYAHRSHRDRRRILIETHIPVDDVITFENDDDKTTSYVAHKYRDLSRWGFRFYNDNDGDIDLRHIVVWDSVNDASFCVISFDELQHETDVMKRVHEYGEFDVDNIAPNSQLRFEWADAIVRGIMTGLRRTRRHYA